MRSAELGKRTSEVEVVSISPHGLWLLIDDREHFLSFRHFPSFKRAPVGSVLNVERPGSSHLHWPDLDVDIAIESIEHPERFPLVTKVRPNKTLQRSAGTHAPARRLKSASARRR